ncbi:putative quinol monooxygenase [Hugonella massiliensis]|uniref:putative quinol monooxygenase n=1 Tax=Hugonella massiliensis TaxID=1720315 RepID=UPI00073F7880|nr:putative quinol monooxygenase [Hugonella massiliensis]
MIRIVAARTVRAECTAAYEELARELVRASAAEDGCASYTLNRKIDDPQGYCFVEVWRDRAALEAHQASAHFKELVPKLGKMAVAGTSHVDVYEEV